MRRRAERKDIDQHPRIITDPVVRPEIAAFGIPAHCDGLRPAAVGRRDAAVLALHEGPVDAAVNLLGQVTDLPIGSASCRERVCPYVSYSVVAVSLKKKKQK